MEFSSIQSPELMQWIFIRGWYIKSGSNLGVIKKYLFANDQLSVTFISSKEVRRVKGESMDLLRCMFLACDINHTVVDEPLVSRIHPLVDLVHDTEWGSGEGL